jgi:hypothetical protein
MQVFYIYKLACKQKWCQLLRYLKLVFNYKYIIYFDEICVFHVNMYTYLYIHVYQQSWAGINKYFFLQK